MSVIDELKALLTLDTSGFSDSIGNADGLLSGFSSNAFKVGASLTAAISVPLMALGGIAISAGLALDEAFDTIRIGTGATGEALAGLEDSFKNVFMNVPATAEDASVAIADLNTRLGITGPALEELATQELNLARITKQDMGETIASTTRLFGDWSVATENQSETLDYMFKVSQNTGIGFNKLTQAVVQFGAPLRNLGFDLETSAAMLGKWEKEGVNTETVLSGMRYALGQFAKSGLDAKDALAQTVEQIKNAKTSAEATSVAFTVFGQRAANDMAAAIREGRFELTDLVKTLKESPETINKAAAATDDFAEKLQLLKNKGTVALEPLGTVLLGLGEKLLEAFEPMIPIIIDVIKWFSELAPSVQMAATGFAAMLAAVGPAMAAFSGLSGAIGPLAAALGVSVTALAGWAVAIAAAVAALIALSVWVYNNWDAIKTTLLFAWDALVEAWQWAWGEIIDWLIDVWESLPGWAQGTIGTLVEWLGYIWTGLKKAWELEWRLIKTILVGTWEGIKIVAMAVWGGITENIEKFLTLAKKIPGVKKLFDLDDVWKSAKKLQDETKALNKDIGDFAEATGKAKKPVTELGGAVGDTSNKVGVAGPAMAKHGNIVEQLGNKHTESKQKVFDYNKAVESGSNAIKVIAQEYKNWQKDLDDTVKELARLRQAMADGEVGAEAFNRVLKEAPQIALDLGMSLDELNKKIPEFKQQIVAIPPEVDKLGRALQKVGEDSLKTLTKAVEIAKEDFETLKNSGIATAEQLNKAWVEWQENAINLARRNGEEIPAENVRMLEKIKGQLKGGTEEQKAVWGDFGNEVSTIMTNLAQDISKSLWDGDLSFAGKGKAALKSLGEAATSTFITPFMNGINDLVSTAFKDLLGGKGLGGTIDRLKEMKDLIGNIFGAGGGGKNVMDTLPGLPIGGKSPINTSTMPVSNVPMGSGGGGGGGGSPASGLGGGLMGTLSAVGAIGTMISSIVGNFQMAKQETTLNAIEHETRYSQIHLSVLLEKMNEYIPNLQFLHEFNYGHMAPWMGAMQDLAEQLLNSLLLNTEAIRTVNTTLLNYGLAGGGGGTIVNNTFNFGDVYASSTEDIDKLLEAINKATGKGTQI